jgi:hypothetical protein
MAGSRLVTPGPAVPDRRAAPAAPAVSPAPPAAVDLGEESVAGEEDPGAALDVDAEPAAAAPPPPLPPAHDGP